MARKGLGGFDVLIDLAGKFVEGQKGMWDDTAWQDFLRDVRKKGFEPSDDMKDYLGSVLEAMKKVYGATTDTKGMENAIPDISELAVKFIKKTQGTWDQSGWESFLGDLQKKGIHLTDETKAYFGDILEATRELYSISPVASKPRKTKKTPEKGKV